VDCISLAVVEDLITSIFTIIAAIALEPDMLVYPYAAIRGSWDIIFIVAAVEGSAVVFGILGQVYINPSITALISSSASVYCAIAGYVFLDELMRLDISRNSLLFLSDPNGGTYGVIRY
jgi:hypothetical protein